MQKGEKNKGRQWALLVAQRLLQHKQEYQHKTQPLDKQLQAWP